MLPSNAAQQPKLPSNKNIVFKCVGFSLALANYISLSRNTDFGGFMYFYVILDCYLILDCLDCRMLGFEFKRQQLLLIYICPLLKPMTELETTNVDTIES